MRTALLLAALLASSVLAGVFAGETLPDEARAAEAFADRDYARGTALYADLLAKDPASPRADHFAMMVVKGLALGGKHAEAAAAGEAYLKDRPASACREKVAFLAGRALLLAGQGEKAGEVLSASLDRLAAPAARAEIARRLVAEGDRAFAGVPPKNPFDAGTPADFARALRLYGLARPLGLPDESRRDVLLRVAKAAFETKAFDVALSALEERAPLPGVPAPDPEAMLLRGRALLGAERPEAARDAFARLVAAAPASAEAPEALLLLDDPASLERIVHEFPAFAKAPAAAFRLGEILAKDGQADRAVAAWLDAAARFPDRPEAAKCALAAADTLSAAERFGEARTRYDEFLRRFPAHPDWAAARDRLIDTWYREGEATKDVAAATKIWEAMREAWPLSPFAPKSLLAEAHRLPPEKALLRLGELLARYPKAAEAPEAAGLAARLLAGLPGRTAEAVAAMKRVGQDYPGTPAAEETARRLAEMQEESLSVVFRHDSVLTVRTRNLERLAGRVYRIDPVAYFRRHGRFAEVAEVMVEVIAPDAVFEHQVLPYEPWREIEGVVKIPLEGRGAALVVLEGKTLKATGLVLSSDITLLVKESPRGAVAFVQDAASGEPVPGASVLTTRADGGILEAVTGPDGTVRIDFPEPGVRSFLAVRGASAAPATLGEGERKVRGLATVVHVATDRPAYRPGQTVSYRAVVRKAAGEFRETPAGEPVVVTAEDAVGNRLHTLKAALSEFGTAAGSFALPADLPPGDYDLAVRYGEETVKSPFKVEAYRKPQIFLEAVPERPVFVRGEEVKVELRARYAFGRPVQGLALEVAAWSKADGRTLVKETLTTNAEGVVRLAMPSEAGPDTYYTIHAETTDATGRRYAMETAVPVAAAAYGAVVKPSRPEVREGEETAVTVLTSDLLGNPVAAEGKVEIARAPLGPSSPAFADVDTLSVKTGEDGKAVLTFTPKEEGRYRLRWRGLDRAGREVVGAAEMRVVAGALDVVVRAERPAGAVGERMAFTVKSPVKGAFALFTFEAEDVYGHRVVRLTDTTTRLEEMLTARLVPEAFATVSLVARGDLLIGSDRIEVREDVAVTVAADRAEYGPGDLCRLTLTTKDAAGNPVPAQVALSVVDEAVYVLYPDKTPPLAAALRPPERKHTVRTAASVKFELAGLTASLSPDLLAERERRKAPEPPKPGVLLAEKDAKEQNDFDGPVAEDAIGIGGGAGGFFGGRGGSKHLRAGGGGGALDDAFPTRRRFEDTAFWRADVVTGPDGTATVEFTLPDDLTKWRATARAVSHGNAAGEAKAFLVTTRPLVVRAALPRFFREGDLLTAGASAVNATAGALPVTVAMAPARDGPEASGTAEIAAGAERFFAWPLPAAGVGTGTYAARVSGGEYLDTEERPVPSLPFGVPFSEGFAGLLDEGGDRVLKVPEDAVPGTLRLALLLPPSPARLAADAWTGTLRDFPHACVEQTVNRFWPALALAEAIRSLGLDAAETLPGLDRVTKDSALRLTYLQSDDGLWGWFRKCRSDSEMTAYALLGLAAARDAGVELPAAVFDKAKAGLPALLAKTTDPDTRAFLLHAQARAFGADFAVLAPAFADRARLGPRGIAHLLLAYGTFGASTQASVLAEDLLARLNRPAAADAETLGFALAALAGSSPDFTRLWPVAAELSRRLDARGFGTTRETGAAVLGLARAARAGLAFEGTGGEVRVVLNGKEQTLPATGRIALPADALVPGENRVALRGARRPYALALTGVRRTAPATAPGLALSRNYALVPPGTGRGEGGLLREGGQRRDPTVRSLAVGEVVRVTLTFSAPAERFLILEDPLPAGFEPVPASEAGAFAEFTRFDDRVAFFVEAGPERDAAVSYLLRAETPGTMRAPPASLVPMYRPSRSAHSESAEFTVAAPGEPLDRDPTAALAAADLMRLGTTAAAEGRAEEADRYLTALFGRYDLAPEAAVTARRALARAKEARKDFAGVDTCYEMLASEAPAFVPGLEDERLRARALRALGRHGDAASALERAAVLMFLADLGALEAAGDEAAARTLFAGTPDHGALETACADLSRRRLTRVEEDLEAGRKPDGALLAPAREFLSDFPASGAGPEIAFRLARVALRRGDFAALESEARRFSDRWPGDALRDDADWYVAYALFAQGRIDEAEAAAKASLARAYRGPDGVEGPTAFHDNLLHLLAQAAHVRGRLDEAVELYRLVEGSFVDAREALRVLTEETLAAPDVIRAGVGEEVAIPVTLRNLPGAEVAVYRIDPLAYLALEKDVTGVGRLNLDGLTPAKTLAVAAAGGASRRERAETAALGRLEPGVYLAFVASKDLLRRTLVVVSDLEARVWTHPQGVRVLVTDRKTGEGVPAAFVKVAGGGAILGQGYTDARGVFEVRITRDLAESGPASAVAEKSNSFALARE